jgi:hypothetical protein
MNERRESVTGFEYILSVEVSHGFKTRTNGIAAGLGGEYQRLFLAAVERHRERLLQEYEADHAAFRRRPGVPAPPQPVANDSASEGGPGSHSANPTARLVRLQDRQFSVAQKSSKALVEGY